MLALLFKNSKSRQDALLIFVSFAVLTILYLLLLRYADKFPSGVPEIFTFVYGIFITIDAYALINSLSKRTTSQEERRFVEPLYVKDMRRYDFLLKEVHKEIDRLEEILPRSKGGEKDLILHQLDSFKKKMLRIQDEKFAEIEKLIQEDEKIAPAR